MQIKKYPISIQAQDGEYRSQGQRDKEQQMALPPTYREPGQLPSMEGADRGVQQKIHPPTAEQATTVQLSSSLKDPLLCIQSFYYTSAMVSLLFLAIVAFMPWFMYMGTVSTGPINLPNEEPDPLRVGFQTLEFRFDQQPEPGYLYAYNCCPPPVTVTQTVPDSSPSPTPPPVCPPCSACPH
ncbi:hypothetical protein EV426DRAFT_323227 [Tirmania nivea]|nr:hypothetical protein EV426DRAFT_323227 [Tirmania nivea]